MRNSFFLAICLCLFTTAYAVTIEQPLANATQESVAQEVFHALKCVVCEGQSLADSDAQLARQMRAHVRHLASEGQSQTEILAYYRERYGERILMRPPMEGRTALLWLAPLLLLIGGGLMVWRATNGKHKESA